jgi:hypothetical protein
MPADFDPSSGSSLAGSSLASSSAAPAAPSMIFDDRLETVLRTRAAGPAGLRVQFRQLVDLLGRVPEQGWNARHDEALARLDTLFEAIATPQEGARPAQAGPAASLSGAEAAAALLAATHLAHPRLVAHFAAQGPRVALASIRGARLDEASWLDLIPRLPIQARGFLRHRRDLGPAVERLLEQLGIDDFALTGPEATAATDAVAEQAPEPMPCAELSDDTTEEPEDLAPDTLFEPASPVSAPIEGIGAIVRRIEAFRRDREERQAAQAVPAKATASGPAPRLSVDSPLAHLPTMRRPRSPSIWPSIRKARSWPPMPISRRCWWATARSPRRTCPPGSAAPKRAMSKWVTGAPLARPWPTRRACGPSPPASRSKTGSSASMARPPSKASGNSMRHRCSRA